MQARERGAAVVLISTDLDEIGALADRAAILSTGTLTEYALEASRVSGAGRSTEVGLLLGGFPAPGDAEPGAIGHAE